MSHLVPHPWDAAGPVLPPGANYPTADLREETKEIEALIAEASEEERNAERKQREADDHYDAAADARKEARQRIEEQIRPHDHDLAERLLKAVNGDGPAWRAGASVSVPPEPMGLA